jgi:hypothetical protein
LPSLILDKKVGGISAIFIRVGSGFETRHCLKHCEPHDNNSILVNVEIQVLRASTTHCLSHLLSFFKCPFKIIIACLVDHMKSISDGSSELLIFIHNLQKYSAWSHSFNILESRNQSVSQYWLFLATLCSFCLSLCLMRELNKKMRV